MPKDIDGILNEGISELPPVITANGFNNLTPEDLFDIGDVVASMLFDEYCYQIFTVAFICNDGRTFIYDPQNTMYDVENVLRGAIGEDLNPNRA